MNFLLVSNSICGYTIPANNLEGFPCLLYWNGTSVTYCCYCIYHTQKVLNISQFTTQIFIQLTLEIGDWYLEGVFAVPFRLPSCRARRHFLSTISGFEKLLLIESPSCRANRSWYSFSFFFNIFFINLNAYSKFSFSILIFMKNSFCICKCVSFHPNIKESTFISHFTQYLVTRCRWFRFWWTVFLLLYFCEFSCMLYTVIKLFLVDSANIFGGYSSLWILIKIRLPIFIISSHNSWKYSGNSGVEIDMLLPKTVYS